MSSTTSLHRLFTPFLLIVLIGSCQTAETEQTTGDRKQSDTQQVDKPAVDVQLAKLVDQLNSEDNAVQAAAAATLARMGDAAAPAVDALVEQLKDDDPHVRAHAARALGSIGDPAKGSAEALAVLIADKDETVRRATIHALRRIKPGKDLIAPLMIKALGNADPQVVALATHNLAEVGPDIVPAMITAMDDERTVYWAILVLEELGPDAKDAVPSLAKALVHEDEEVRHEAAQALRAIGPGAQDAIPQLIAALDDQFVQMPAALALGSIGPPAKDALEKLRDVTKEDDDVMEVCAIWAIASIEDDDAKLKSETAPALVEFLVNDDQAVRRSAALALLQLEPGPEVMAPLISKVFETASDEARSDMIEAVATLGAAGVPRLIQALKFPAIRSQVVQVLGKIGPAATDAVPALLEHLDDEDAGLRADILVALGHIGPGAKQATEAALAALEDEDEEVVVSAIYALGKIGPDAVDCAGGIKGLLDGGNPRYATVCAWALVKVVPDNEEYQKVAIPLLIKALEHDEDSVRSEAASTLGSIGPAAKNAREKLQELAADDPNPDVRELAAEALKALGQ
ncbi:MAG: HEAT repeat domain-containing protein [Pirellulales bacterium]|nr:HEAT repeat domain-containing protein [Pirellulales bacterium]